MTDGRVLSKQSIRQREKDAILWLECNPDDLKTKRELDLFATIRDLQCQLSELKDTNEILRDNMHQAFGYMAQCPQCRGILPDHADGCALYEAMEATK
ncbi:hypothetical protein [Alicyclobacillus acidoterrestris]|uniref:Uncharacterized protein n=1 Tax=Alicyclobacillus acidoterrestris (strain ATCC 49025 / DSM 3922 / CIP 106132 / NCIMB 13137 / GD3B) TaxID=1356854 RepID=T0D8B2_ALIAG|nr:hypothetical protein [Alicyclobacillus acidoterrestris]EPZ47747.1 hypothetical protein N007_05690 [Alicyclobacillus acidoterrestris ATCC 49025]UNO47948.1 hypothetical protein K1I37_14835 [Alicyclobacillus acidoterrestris]